MTRSNDTEILVEKKTDKKENEQSNWRQLYSHIRKASLVCIVSSLILEILLIIYTLTAPDRCLLGPHICEPHSSFKPEQLHLSLGANDTEYYVTWSTVEPTTSYLIYDKTLPGNVQISIGERTDGLFPEPIECDYLQKLWRLFNNNDQKYRKYSYRAKMIVELNAEYLYKVVSCTNDIDCHAIVDDASRLGVFATKKEDDKHSSRTYRIVTKHLSLPSRPLNVLFYGDLGLLNAQSVPRLTDEFRANDLIIHNGDFAYDLNTQNGAYGDRFMRLMEPIAAQIPYQTSVGNHEIAANFSEYNHRFTMINRGAINHGAQNNFFYSFNAGPVHFVAISTEFYYFLKYVGIASLVDQYDWLKKDLEHASSASERAIRPWLVVFGHRPMYCSSRDHDDCSKDSNLLRRGLPFTGAYALEKLFYDFGVDVELYSHEHQYERFLPIFDGRVFNGTDNPHDPYRNPGAPVHVISGSAGCQEKLDPFEGRPATGSVKQISDYGFTRIKATECSLEFEQISDDKSGTIVDKFTITKTRQNFPKQDSVDARSC